MKKTILFAIILLSFACGMCLDNINYIFSTEEETVDTIDVERKRIENSVDTFKIEIEEYIKEGILRQETFDSTTGGCFRIATSRDYSIWLNEYLLKGNAATHTYDYPMSRHDGWFIATRDFSVTPLYGSNCVYIIIPENIEFLGGDLGHSNLYFMNDSKVMGGRFIPIYSDTFY